MTAIPGRHREGVRDWLDHKPPPGLPPTAAAIDLNRNPFLQGAIRMGTAAEMPAVDPFVDDTGQLAPPPASSRREVPADA